MLDHGIGRRHQMQRLAVVPQLPARFLAARFAQALRLAPQPIAGGRFAPVVAVLGALCLQLPHPRQQHRHLLAQHRQFAHLRLQRGVLGFQLGNPGLWVWRHASRLHLLRKSG